MALRPVCSQENQALTLEGCGKAQGDSCPYSLMRRPVKTYMYRRTNMTATDYYEVHCYKIASTMMTIAAIRCVCTCVYAHIHVYISMCMHTSMCLQVCWCMHPCICIFVHM